MIQDYDMNTMQNRMINPVYLDRICSFCGIHVTTNPDLSIGTRLGDFIADFFTENDSKKNDPRTFYLSFVMQYYSAKTDYHAKD